MLCRCGHALSRSLVGLTVNIEYSREPGILVVTPSQLGARMMALKISLPALNIPELIRRYPKILRYKVGLRSCEHW